MGSVVTLEYDVERTDRFGRTLAGVLAADGTLVNAEVARAGLAAAIVVGENDRFYPPVREAQQEAAAAARGLHSPAETCTLPARVEAATAALSGAPTLASHGPAASVAGLEAAAADVDAVLVTTADLAAAFDGDRTGAGWAAFDAAEQERLASRVTGARESATQEAAELRGAAATIRARDAETARLAAEAETARLAEQERRAEAERTAAAERRAEERRADTDSGPDPDSDTDGGGRSGSGGGASAPGSGDPYPGYTGPRCYHPGGKTYDPC